MSREKDQAWYPWMWHALFDGTRLCRCPYSRRERTAARVERMRRNWW